MFCSSRHFPRDNRPIYVDLQLHPQFFTTIPPLSSEPDEDVLTSLPNVGQPSAGQILPVPDLCRCEHLARVMVVAFSSLVRALTENWTIHSRLRFFFFFFLKWRLDRAHLFHCLGQDQCTVAQ